MHVCYLPAVYTQHSAGISVTHWVILGFFLPHRMTHCTDEGEISLNFTIFTPVGAGAGARTEKLKICNFRIPIGICLGRFYQILRVCRKLQFASIIEIWENSFEGFWIYGGFNLESAF